MIRSFAVALVTIVVVSVFGAAGGTAAQPANATSFPVDFRGVTPGYDLDLFFNAGKVADVPVNPQGEGSWLLDLGNLGKTQLQVYVDVCQDGKTMKVLVVSGQPTPEDRGCKRRALGGAFWSDCGVTRLTLDLTKFGMRVVGCGSFYTEPKFFGPVGGAVVVGGLLLGGGSDGNSPVVTAPIVTPTVTTTTTTPTVTTTPVTPPVATPPVATPPATTPTPDPVPTAPTTPVFNYSVNMTTTGVVHTSPGNFSDLCFTFLTDPAQANQPFTGSATGPGVQQPSITGTTNSAGRGSGQFRIVSFGSYNITISMSISGLVKTATGFFNVTSGAAPCQ